MDQGTLVPDDLVVAIVKERLMADDLASGYVLDGFPRTVAQAEALEKLGVEIDKVVDIEVAEEEIVRRLTGRLTCSNCGAMFHIDFMPPKVAGVCDKCGGILGQRVDDNEDTVRNRLAVYQAQTHPLVDFYRSRAKLVEVDGTGGTPETVYGKVREILEAAKASVEER